MSDESYSFSTARARLEEIVSQVRKKDTSLEKSLDLLEEGVRLANSCTELIDHADWTVGGTGDVPGVEAVEGQGTDVDAVVESDDAAASAEADELSAEATTEPEESADARDTDGAAGESAEPDAQLDDAEMAADDDAFGDAADEAWADGTPEYRDDEA